MVLPVYTQCDTNTYQGAVEGLRQSARYENNTWAEPPPSQLQHAWRLLVGHEAADRLRMLSDTLAKEYFTLTPPSVRQDMQEVLMEVSGLFYLFMDQLLFVLRTSGPVDGA